MPTSFPTLNADTGELVDTVYYFSGEAAPRLHVSVRTLERRCQRREWPCLKVAGTYYFSAADIAAIVDMQRVTPEPPGPAPRRLGVVMADDDLDGLGGVR